MKSLVLILALVIPLAAGTADSFLIRGATVHPYICRLLDLDRRQPVPRFTRHRQVPHVSLR